MSIPNKPLETSVTKRAQGANRTLFKDTLARALLADDSKQLRKLCDEMLNQALNSNLSASERLAAIKLIIERVDGKPAQSVEVIDATDRPEAGLFKIVKVESGT